jgi:hypothetical protein
VRHQTVCAYAEQETSSAVAERRYSLTVSREWQLRVLDGKGGKAARRFLKTKQDFAKALAIFYTGTVEKQGEDSPGALILRTMLRQEQHDIIRTRYLWRQAVQRTRDLRVHQAGVWRVLLTMLAAGGPRKDPPLGGVHGRLSSPGGTPLWSPWTGLAPPVPPSPILRQ